MSKRTVSLEERLAAAHRFISAQRKRCENYGSSLSESIAVECESFLRHNKPLKEGKMMLIPKWRYQQLIETRLAMLKARAAAKGATQP